MSDIKAPQHSFCILPFMHLSTRTDGAMQLCCHTNSSGKMGDSMPGCNRDDEGNIVYLKNKNHSIVSRLIKYDIEYTKKITLPLNKL